MSTLRIPACWMRGGTSKGVFFLPTDLPADAARRDALLLRVLGSPDPYGKQIDGLGGASSSTSKVVIVGPSARADCDVDYLFGQVPVGDGPIDWSGNCGNLTAAVGPFAIARGLLGAVADGVAQVRIWQANIGKRIDAWVPVAGGEVVEAGPFMLDGVAFPSAEIRLEFLDPAGDEGLFPSGRPVDRLTLPDGGHIDATLINAGNPLVLVAAAVLGVRCDEPQSVLNARPDLLARCEAIRVAGALAMGLADHAAAAARRPHTPKLALLAPPLACRSADGRSLRAADLDLACRVPSIGVFHHAIPGTGAIAIAAGASVPGTLAQRLLARPAGALLQLGHPSGRTGVGVEAREQAGGWRIRVARMSRSARVLMDGQVCVPGG
jgi:probable AcnD-accessory protein PrpF